MMLAPRTDGEEGKSRVQMMLAPRTDGEVLNRRDVERKIEEV